MKFVFATAQTREKVSPSGESMLLGCINIGCIYTSCFILGLQHINLAKQTFSWKSVVREIESRNGPHLRIDLHKILLQSRLNTELHLFAISDLLCTQKPHN